MEKDDLNECFVVSQVVKGVEYVHELKEHGRELKITEANKAEYIHLR